MAHTRVADDEITLSEFAGIRRGGLYPYKGKGANREIGVPTEQQIGRTVTKWRLLYFGIVEIIAVKLRDGHFALAHSNSRRSG
jgi:hypothetical protein